MKTFTKQTENTYLENDPVYGNLMLKQEYNDIKVNDIITVEKVEKYRSSEYINTTYYVKN